MVGKLDYRWNLRHVMADRGMFATTDLIPPAAARPGSVTCARAGPASPPWTADR